MNPADQRSVFGSMEAAERFDTKTDAAKNRASKLVRPAAQNNLHGEQFLPTTRTKVPLVPRH